MTITLAGGAGGMAAFIQHLGPAFTALWHDLGKPSLSPATAALLVEGLAAEINGQSMADIVSRRDATLVRLLKAETRFGAASIKQAGDTSSSEGR